MNIRKKSKSFFLVIAFYLLLPAFIAGGVFYFLKPSLSREFSSDQRLPAAFAIAAGEYVPVGATEGEKQQIFIGEPPRLVTNTSVAKAQVSRSGKYVVWMQELRGGWQIMWHHLGSGQSLALTITGNNLNPQLAGETIAWEQVRGDGRNIILFDGRGTRRVVSEGVAINPTLSADGSKMVFATRSSLSQNPSLPPLVRGESVENPPASPDEAIGRSWDKGDSASWRRGFALSEGEWVAIEYDLATRQHAEVARSLEAKHPFYRGGDGTLAFGLMEQQANSRIAGARHVQLTGSVPLSVPAPEPKHRQRTSADTLDEFNQKPLIEDSSLRSE